MSIPVSEKQIKVKMMFASSEEEHYLPEEEIRKKTAVLSAGRVFAQRRGEL